MRKFLALVLSFVLTAGAVSTVANAAKFTDVPASDETLTKAVDLLSSVGITTGTTETTFGTSEGVTRQQMATFIYRLMKAGKTVEGGDNTTTFTDLDDPFYYFMVSWANEMGIIKGRSATTFDPKGGIILQDAYVMITRALGYEKKKTLDYPYDYISIAEDIGLDEGLPANVNYDTALTRGNVAILLYNAFYADMATGETAYKTEYTVKTLLNGKQDVVKSGQTAYTVYDKVASSIFNLKRTVQRVVATPNYSLDNYAKTDSDNNESEIITVACFDKEYIDNDAGLFGDIEFAALGLEGKADDYFLIDLSIYYKQEGKGDPEIVSATSLGTYKKQLPGSKVKFATDPNIAYQGDGNSKAATGKVTIDGQESYLFDAPWSYSKPSDMSEKDDECITLLWLDATERDPEEEEYVQDFNFKSHRDVLGRGGPNDTTKAYDVQCPSIFYKVGGKWLQGCTQEYYDKLAKDPVKNKATLAKLIVKPSMPETDPRGGGIYTSAAMAGLIQMGITSANFEADAWDSNSDGKYDYLWLKPYTVGVACVDEGDPFIKVHKAKTADPKDESILDTISAIFEDGKVPTIYTYGANNDGGADFKDGQLITGYINGPANYMRIQTAIDVKYEENQVYDGKSGNSYSFNGNRAGRSGMCRNYVGVPNEVGDKKIAAPGSQATWVACCYGNNLELGKAYDLLFVSGSIFHMKSSSGKIVNNSKYAIIPPNNEGTFAYTKSVGIIEDGIPKKTGDMLGVMIDGELRNVQVNPQTSQTVADNDSSRPVTPYNKNAEIYDFSKYVGRLLTYTVNSDDIYTFKLVLTCDKNNTESVLYGDDEDAYYSRQVEADDQSTFEQDGYMITGSKSAAFVNISDNNNLYQFVKTGTNQPQPDVYTGKYLIFTENTKVIIKTYDEDSEPVYTTYDYDNMPNFSNKDNLIDIKYIVKNNPNSTTIEELIFLYAEASSGKTTERVDATFDYRFVKSTLTAKVEDAIVIYYDVYNPFTGKVEEQYEAVTETDKVTCDINGIYAVSNGYIDDEHKLGNINVLGSMSTANVSTTVNDLGLVKLADFDAESGLLTVEGSNTFFLVDEETKITFLDLDEETITTKKADILSSTAKTYRCADDKDMPLLAFIASSEVKKEDYEHAELICVVRYNDLIKLK